MQGKMRCDSLYLYVDSCRHCGVHFLILLLGYLRPATRHVEPREGCRCHASAAMIGKNFNEKLRCEALLTTLPGILAHRAVHTLALGWKN